MTTEKHKQCFKCGESKPLSAFYKHPKMADGHVNKCKECNKKDVNENRELKLDYYQEYDRQRSRLHESERYVKKLERAKELIRISPEARAKKAEHLRRYRELYPERATARYVINNSIRDGKLVRPTNCEHCGKECKPQAHHSSYAEDMQLLVTWLCTKCHGEVHRDYE